MGAYEYCRYLADEIGFRWIGSDGEKRAGAWIEQQFQRMGYEVRRLWFDCPAWDYERTELSIEGNAMVAGAQMFSAPCSVEAELILVQPGDDAEVPGEVEGKIAVIREEDTGNGILFRNQLLQSLQKAGALAAVIKGVLPETYGTKLFRNPEATIPCAAVNATDGKVLMARIGSTAKLEIVSRQRRGKTSDVFGEKGPADAPVITVAAHMDATPISRGAVDNASGIGVMLEVAAYFAPTDPGARLRFSAFGGHEFGGKDMCGFGSKSYVNKYGEEVAKIGRLLHLDALGIEGTQPMVKVHGGDELLGKVRNSLSALDIPVDFYGGAIGADFGAFAREGIEFVMPHCSESDYFRCAYHSPLDDMRWIGTGEDLRAYVAMSIRLIEDWSEEFGRRSRL